MISRLGSKLLKTSLVITAILAVLLFVESILSIWLPHAFGFYYSAYRTDGLLGKHQYILCFKASQVGVLHTTILPDGQGEDSPPPPVGFIRSEPWGVKVWRFDLEHEMGMRPYDWGKFGFEFRHQVFAFDPDTPVIIDDSYLMPSWLAIAGLALIQVPFWWGRRRVRLRKREGLCSKCGYDLRASRERCSECGTAIPGT